MKYSVDELRDIYEQKYGNISLSGSEREVLLYRKYRRLFAWSDSVPSPQMVLDLGCGTGFKTVGFHKEGEKTLAIDLSENGIQFCNTVHHNSEIEFEAKDAFEVEGSFELITAFGFSLFNTEDNQEFLKNVGYFIEKNLSSLKGSLMLIGSFTDFSGGGKESWYLHTRKDLKYITEELSARFKVKAEVIFPHRTFRNYVGFGWYNLFAELYKLVFKRKKTFFIRISYE